jgi:hypothetical protein
MFLGPSTATMICILFVFQSNKCEEFIAQNVRNCEL